MIGFLQNIVDFFGSIFDTLVSLGSLLVHLLTSLVHLLISIPNYIVLLTQSVGTLPAYILPFAMAFISIAVVQYILNRTGG